MVVNNFIHMYVGNDVLRITYDKYIGEFVIIITEPLQICYQTGNNRKISKYLSERINTEISGSCDMRFFHEKTKYKKKIDKLCSGEINNTSEFWIGVLLYLKLVTINP